MTRNGIGFEGEAVSDADMAAEAPVLRNSKGRDRSRAL